ncbi:GGDEF domain-containing protein [Candidatus Aminicenantes bacterium AC-335-B20]|jgi:diguanylate cyclase (GGDEF)-like protein|nr:GGDEF domain-containing protein [SCandidatus Aminicenantes bacterium Aminicenantia_JdfR_composite]MCP2596699.1 GGDEF domain-containing protein [Candidatus Aminicenantes bacterium AC-335-G13]MCP2598942.1 GGDEF domain-containing protein [Candidatus Aminicenantes bacterium AC-335-B20]
MKNSEKEVRGPLSLFSAIKDRNIINKELNRGFLRLKFSPPVEEAFTNYYFHHSITLMRISFILGLLIYASFGILDMLIYPEFLKALWAVRFGIGCPIIWAIFFASFYVKKEIHLQLITSIGVFTIGITVIIMLIIISSDPSQKYYVGLMLVIFYGYLAIGLRFRYAIPACWGIAIAYFLLSFFLIRPEFHFLISNSFTLFFANLIGMIGNFLFEKSIRRNFLLSNLISIDKEELEAINLELEKLSVTDELTKLANRRYFEDFLEKEWSSAMRYRYPISLMMIDIDYFKNYNDHYGHRAGDECLVRIASAIKDFERRHGDLVARYGGEEFVMILSGTDADNGRRIAEEIRKKIMDLRIPHPASAISDVVTVSIGAVTLIPSKNIQKEDVLEAADKALYQAKSEGRNRTVYVELN